MRSSKIVTSRIARGSRRGVGDEEVAEEEWHNPEKGIWGM